ncbi:hypothetical protein SAMN05421742_11320 [Roseospirillum parvum]|uniref:Uncharacterized protein n=2 Tax=Roseospirillum parvum TaxID=83401 RepID=A0A1G8FBG9_9PROT|nr:hypothetical protein SAMN05421742_11320 [Roseospirillum parvum]
MTGGSSSVVAAAAPPAITEPPAGGATDQAFVAAAATAGTDGTSTNLAKVNNQAGRTYTLALADDGRLIRCTNAETITVTVPAQSSVAWPAGAVVHIEQGGAGTVTVAGARGVTVNSRDGMDSTVGQHSVATLMRVAEDTWTLTGDIE